jgi:predicted alpha-1,2-mannosidase
MKLSQYFASLLFMGIGFPIATGVAAAEFNATQFVNPFIGTAPADPSVRTGPKAAAGNTYPGAVCPHGMVAWSPDTTQISRNASGYAYYDPTILDFSLTHFSGRAVMYLMDFPFMPVVQPITASPGTDWTPFAAAYSHTNEIAVPGYYRVKLDNGIKVELTATPRTGMARLTFPPSSSSSSILIRASSINSNRGSISIKDDEVAGACDDTIGGKQRSFKIYFVAEFDRHFKTARTWLGDSIQDVGSSQTISGNNCGAILTFDTTTSRVVQARVGISFVSLQNARENLKQENPGWDFDATRLAADALWNGELGRIEIEGGTPRKPTVLYFVISLLHPPELFGRR